MKMLLNFGIEQDSTKVSLYKKFMTNTTSEWRHQILAETMEQ